MVRKKITRKKRLKTYMQRYAPHAAGFSVLAVSLFIGAYMGAAFLLPSTAMPATAEAAVIPGQYIVVFKEAVAANTRSVSSLQADKTALAVVRANLIKKFKTRRVFSKALNGFSATLSSVEVATLQADPTVAYVVPDRVINEAAVTTPPQILPMGIDRINAQNLASKGAGVEVAVLDTGIDSTHPDLAGQVIGGTNCVTATSTSYEDDRGHGTHVAGTIAALDNNFGVVGVAPQAKLWSVKVIDASGSGTWSSVICGVDFVTAHAPANGGNIKVANMSLGGVGTSDNNCGLTDNDPLHASLCRARDAGVTFVVAAGNNGGNTSSYIPAAYDDTVITVSALQDADGMQGGRANAFDDMFASFSNYGAAVDIGAPGVNILSTTPVAFDTVYGTSGYNSMSGTSMATPHVAGAAADYISAHPTAVWTEVRDALVTTGEPAGPNLHKALDTGGTLPHPEPVLLMGPNPVLPPLPGDSISFSVSPSSPLYTPVVAGTTGQIVGTYALHGVNEAINVTKLGLRITSNPSDVAKFYIYNGTTLLGSGVFAAGQTTATTTFATSLALTTLADTLLTVKVDVAQVGSGKPGVSGELIQINPAGIEGTGQTSGTVFKDSGAGSVAGIRAFKTLPTFLQAGMVPDGLYNGVNVLANTVVQPGTQGGIGIAKLTYKMTILGGSVANPIVKIYSDPDLTQQVGPTVVSSLGSGDVVTNQPFTFTFAQPAEIPAGAQYYISLLGTVTVSSNTQLTTALMGDPVHNALLTAADPLFATSGAFVWSPNTNGTSPLTASDWTNVYSRGGILAVQERSGDGTTPPPPPPPTDTTPPAVSFTAPAANAVVGVGKAVTVSANASDNAAVSKVEFYAGATLICSDAAAPYTCSWTVPAAINTAYVLKATATDSSGNVTTTTRTVTAKDLTAPTTSVTNPHNNASVTRGTKLTLTAAASDNIAVASVKFLVNNSVVCTDIVAPYSCAWTALAKTTYQIKSQATDTSGNITTSSTISLKSI